MYIALEVIFIMRCAT